MGALADAFPLERTQIAMNQDIDAHSAALWPLFVYSTAVVGIAVAILLLTYLLGEKHRDRDTELPYESGVSSTGSARIRLTAKFYLFAMFFLIFDLEAVYIFSWAVAARQVGWLGYVELLVFVGMLVVALVYLWRLGALDWGPHSTRRSRLATGSARKGALR